MDPISAGIIGLAFVLLVVFCVLARNTWHWVNIVFLILTFIAGVAASIGMAQVFELRSTAMAEAQKQEQRVEQETEDADLAVYGSPESITYDKGSLRGASQALELALTGRGRVWSGGTVAAEGNLRTFTFPTARPADDPNQLKLKDVLLYAFADGPIFGQPYPQAYIGSVFVSEESPQALTLQPVFIANGAEWSNPSTTWSLFERMPLDRHDTFKTGFVAAVESNPDAREKIKTFAESIRNGEMEIGPFRDLLIKQYLKPELFPNMDPAGAEYEKLIDRYAFDGLSLREIATWIEANAGTRIAQRFEPAPEEVFVKYRFKSKSKRAYKVDADGSLETDGPFTPLGQAIETSLHAGKDIEFNENDTVLVDQFTAEGYQRGNDQIPPFASQEDVEEIDRIYKRELRDFPYMLSDLSTQTERFIEETDRIRQNNAVQDKALADTELQLQDRLTTTAGLEEDNANLKIDLDTIQALFALRDEENRGYLARIQSLQEEIRKAYVQIQENARQAERKAFAGTQ